LLYAKHARPQLIYFLQFQSTEYQKYIIDIFIHHKMIAAKKKQSKNKENTIEYNYTNLQKTL